MGHKQDSTALYFTKDAFLHPGYGQPYMELSGRHSSSAALNKKMKE
jgi:hypothetical protein